MAEKKLKIWENRCKVCAHHFDHSEARWKKTSITPFYPMYCRCAPVARYRVPRKTVKFVPVVPKAHGRANVCAHLNSIKPCKFLKCFGAFYREWYVVVHPCSNFSLRCQMASVQSIKFQTANFPIFCARINVIFWTTCTAREVFSLVIIGNVTDILPVLQWLKVSFLLFLVWLLFGFQYTCCTLYFQYYVNCC